MVSTWEYDKMIKRILEWFRSLGSNRFKIRRKSDSSMELHCTNGPAIDFRDNEWVWRLHGLRHRYYGPSDKFGSTAFWFIHDEYIKHD